MRPHQTVRSALLVRSPPGSRCPVLHVGTRLPLPASPTPLSSMKETPDKQTRHPLWELGGHNGTGLARTGAVPQGSLPGRRCRPAVCGAPLHAPARDPVRLFPGIPAARTQHGGPGGGAGSAAEGGAGPAPA